MRVYVWVCAWGQARPQVYMHKYIWMYTYVYIYRYIYTYTYIYIYTYIYVYLCIYILCMLGITIMRRICGLIGANWSERSPRILKETLIIRIIIQTLFSHPNNHTRSDAGAFSDLIRAVATACLCVECKETRSRLTSIKNIQHFGFSTVGPNSWEKLPGISKFGAKNHFFRKKAHTFACYKWGGGEVGWLGFYALLFGMYVTVKKWWYPGRHGVFIIISTMVLIVKPWAGSRFVDKVS